MLVDRVRYLMENAGKMKMLVNFFIVFFLALLLFLVPSSKAQGTFTAASSAESDVSAVINGPTHTAVNGDVIKIPCSGTQTVTWTSTLSTTASIKITALGGTP